MKPNYKFLRVVLGSLIGAALAGCATNRDIAYEPAGARLNDSQSVHLDRQVNVTKWQPDTHPESHMGWIIDSDAAPEAR
jgi:hypothetical protein